MEAKLTVEECIEIYEDVWCMMRWCVRYLPWICKHDVREYIYVQEFRKGERESNMEWKLIGFLEASFQDPIYFPKRVIAGANRGRRQSLSYLSIERSTGILCAYFRMRVDCCSSRRVMCASVCVYLVYRRATRRFSSLARAEQVTSQPLGITSGSPLDNTYMYLQLVRAQYVIHF